MKRVVMVTKNVNHNHRSVTGCQTPPAICILTYSAPRSSTKHLTFNLHLLQLSFSLKERTETVFTLSLFLLPLLHVFNNILYLFLVPHICLFCIFHIFYVCVMCFMDAAWGEDRSKFPTMWDNKANTESWTATTDVVHHLRGIRVMQQKACKLSKTWCIKTKSFLKDRLG